MKSAYLIVAVGAVSVTACATSLENSFAAGRTVFDNPYVAPEAQPASDESAGLLYPGAGPYAYDRDGNRVELTKAERRAFRERAQNASDQADLNELVREFDARDADMRLEPAPSGPPIASGVEPR